MRQDTSQINNVRATGGFSLVELTVVLLVLALVTGGIIGGKSMIENAALRSVAQETESFRRAAQQFQERHFALPGDMRDASSIWGGIPGECTDTTAIAKKIPTCNGNGNGIVEVGYADGDTTESYLFWQQLGLAGLIDGRFTGLAGPDGALDNIPGENVPESAVRGGCYHISHNQVDGTMYQLDYGDNQMMFGENGTHCGEALLSAKQARFIDEKIDDGQPARGRVIARYWDDACAAANDGGSANNDLDASYRVSSSGLPCALIFLDPFMP